MVQSPDRLVRKPAILQKIQGYQNRSMAVIVLLVMIGVAITLIPLFRGIEKPQLDTAIQPEHQPDPRQGGARGNLDHELRGFLDDANRPVPPPPSEPQQVVATPPAPPPVNEWPRMRGIDPLEEQLKELDRKLFLEALTGTTEIDGNWAGQRQTLAAPSPPSSAAGLGRQNQASATATASAMAARGGYGNLGGDADPNLQDRKEQFLRSAGRTSETYLMETVMDPASPYQLNAGWLIPTIVQTGINSDLPGQFSLLVSENVYDSRTGRYLLIPQGAKVIGRYDNRVAFGQSRVLVVLNQLQFPDGRLLNLDGQPGVDGEGYAGFSDEVDRHFGRLFLAALISSVFSTSIELADGPNAGLAARIGDAFQREVGRTGTQYAQRELNVQPTIRIRPGNEVHVQLDRAMVLPGPYPSGK